MNFGCRKGDSENVRRLPAQRRLSQQVPTAQGLCNYTVACHNLMFRHEKSAMGRSRRTPWAEMATSWHGQACPRTAFPHFHWDTPSPTRSRCGAMSLLEGWLYAAGMYCVLPGPGAHRRRRRAERRGPSAILDFVIALLCAPENPLPRRRVRRSCVPDRVAGHCSVHPCLHPATQITPGHGASWPPPDTPTNSPLCNFALPPNGPVLTSPPPPHVPPLPPPEIRGTDCTEPRPAGSQHVPPWRHRRLVGLTAFLSVLMKFLLAAVLIPSLFTPHPHISTHPHTHTLLADMPYLCPMTRGSTSSRAQTASRISPSARTTVKVRNLATPPPLHPDKLPRSPKHPTPPSLFFFPTIPFFILQSPQQSCRGETCRTHRILGAASGPPLSPLAARPASASCAALRPLPATTLAP